MKQSPKALIMLEAAKAMEHEPDEMMSEEDGEEEAEDGVCVCPKCGHEFEPE